MLNSVRKAIERYDLFDEVHEVTVAFSGGADSVSLLHILWTLRNDYGFKLYAAHLNHCLRGAESDRDEQFARNFCDKLGITLFCEKADVKGFAEKQGDSIELAARKIRYEFLQRVSKGVIATAHTANDNIETVIHNLIRGTGITGLCGIPPKRDNIIRPLILVQRSQIEKYCHDNSLNFCIDSTNYDENYTRNKIRHSVVPVLTEINTCAVKNAATMSALLREDANFIKNEADKAYKNCIIDGGLSVTGLIKLPLALRSRCLAEYYKKTVGKIPEQIHISSLVKLLNSGKGRIGVQNGFSAVITKNILRISKAENYENLPIISLKSLPLIENNIKVYVESAESFKNKSIINNLLLKCALDYDKILGEPTLRGRVIGDKIKLAGRNVTKSLKKLFNEYQINESLRNRIPVVSDKLGVIWIYGFGADERTTLTEDTKRVLVIEISENFITEGSI